MVAKPKSNKFNIFAKHTTNYFISVRNIHVKCGGHFVKIIFQSVVMIIVNIYIMVPDSIGFFGALSIILEIGGSRLLHLAVCIKPGYNF